MYGEQYLGVHILKNEWMMYQKTLLKDKRASGATMTEI